MKFVSFRGLFGRLPLGQLGETLLTGPHGGVDDLQEELSCPSIQSLDIL